MTDCSFAHRDGACSGEVVLYEDYTETGVLTHTDLCGAHHATCVAAGLDLIAAELPPEDPLDALFAALDRDE